MVLTYQRLPLYDDFIFSTFFKYWQNPSFLINLRFLLPTVCIVISKVSWKFPWTFEEKIHLYPREYFLEPQMRQRIFQTPIVQSGLMQIPSFHWLILAQIFSFSPSMLEYCDIHPDLWCPLIPKNLDIPRQIGYLNQSYKVSDVTDDSMNLPIRNVRRLIWTYLHPY